jgi:hypothetical protein
LAGGTDDRYLELSISTTEGFPAPPTKSVAIPDSIGDAVVVELTDG